ncbi:alpha/beta fold hydrolase [Pseudoalteromonas rubra]|uniref:alpha/beta fold hydrolase n=1 Tax=Pseudoalteromonas rubra TaxID=43658 RepID=UPI000F77EC57|nr:alpha/beta hydrolase [Pseudoalteromonas rubra]
MHFLVKTCVLTGCLASTSGWANNPVKSSFNQYLAFDWGSCPSQFQSRDGSNECTLAQVPLNWEEPTGKQIEVLVSKHPARSGNSRGQIWFLQGGPGGSGSFFVNQFDSTLASFTNDYDLYVLEHRGVGWSTHLGCNNPPSQDYQAYWQDCFDDLYNQWGEGLYQFNTTSAAKDLDYVIGKSKVLDWQPSHVYGVSYGTFWAQRFSQVAPTGAQSLILDSVFPATGAGLDLWDENYGKIFTQLSHYCDQDALCSSKFHGQAEQTIRSLLKRVFNDEHCPDLAFIRDELQAFATVSMTRSVEQILMPAFYRLARCNSDDVVALNNLHQFILRGEGRELVQLPAKDPLGYSSVLARLISNNELNDVNRDLTARLAFCQDAVACYPTYFLLQKEVDKSIWGNRYSDEFIYQNMHHYMPTLVINGDVDPQTPHYDIPLIQAAFTNINQRYVEFQQTEHGVVFVSHMNEGSETCGAQVMMSFIDNLWSEPETSCLNNLKGLNFSASEFESLMLFGASDAYEGAAQTMTFAQRVALKQAQPAQFTQAVGTFARLVDW